MDRVRGRTRVFGSDIGIDLGTATVLIYVKGKGIVLREPSVVAVDLENGRILAVGNDAKSMVGRTPGSIVSVRPLRDGVIADYSMTEAMLHHFMKRVTHGFSRFFRNRVMICVPSGATDVERRAVLEAAIEVGAKEAYLIEEPMAAAIGADLNVEEPRGKMVVDIGGGTSDIAVISLGGIVVSKSLRIGGDKFDEAIMRYLRKQYSLAIGEQTAENLKIMIGTCIPQEEEMTMILKGRDLVQGLPRQIEVSSSCVSMAIGEMVQSLVDGVRNVLELTPPELSADIIDRGIVLTGGGSLLRGLPELISEQTGINCFVAEEPMESVARGTGKALAEIDKLNRLGRSGILATSRKGRKWKS
jgi:rod shape-determining protein MreB